MYEPNWRTEEFHNVPPSWNKEATWELFKKMELENLRDGALAGGLKVGSKLAGKVLGRAAEKEASAVVKGAPKGAMTGQTATAAEHEFVEFATRNKDAFERAISNRMKELGIPANRMGLPNEAGTAMEVFTPGTGLGGGYNVQGLGIQVESGILNKNLQRYSSTWGKAAVRDRLDAVMLHEYAEMSSAGKSVGARHLEALDKAPELAKQFKVSDTTKKILEEMKGNFPRGPK